MLLLLLATEDFLLVALESLSSCGLYLHESMSSFSTRNLVFHLGQVISNYLFSYYYYYHCFKPLQRHSSNMFTMSQKTNYALSRCSKTCIFLKLTVLLSLGMVIFCSNL